MQRYTALVAYDGTDYYGWQAQRGKPTIAHTMQDAFKKVFNQSIKIAAVSRTDAGVHAFGQVISFSTTLALKPSAMLFAWNNRLPKSILIRSLKKSPASFRLHRNVAEKTYIYQIFTRRPSPFLQQYGWHVRQALCLTTLKKTLDLFIGTHDFKSFCSDDQRGDDTIRTIDSITIRHKPRMHGYQIIIKGPRFLRYMIRRIVGAAITVAKNGTITPEYVLEILKKKDPCHMLINAPPCGLTLHRVRYNKQIFPKKSN